MKTVETHDVAARAEGRSVQVDLDEPEGTTDWCMILVTPDLVAKIDEIARRVGEPPDVVLVRAVIEYDKTTREAER